MKNNRNIVNIDTGRSPDPVQAGQPEARIDLDLLESYRTAERLAKINECFLSFGPDSDENINRLTALCGELLEATCALYNRLDQGMLCSTGQWRTPPDYNVVDKPDGHICYDVIRQSGNETLVVRNLFQTAYAQTDPNVLPYQLQTYVGQPVKCGEVNVGSLCVVFQRDFIPSEEDKKLMSIIASAVGVEEERKQVQEALRKLNEELEDRVLTRTAELSRVNTELVHQVTARKRAAEADRRRRVLAEALSDNAVILNNMLDLNEVLDRILDSVKQVVPHDMATIMLVEDDIARIVRRRVYVRHDDIEDYVSDPNFSIQRTPNLKHMCETGKSMIIPEIHNYSGWVPGDRDWWEKAYLGAPIRLRDEVIGFFNLISANPFAFTPENAEALEMFAYQAATAIQNAQLYQEAQQELAERKRAEAALQESEKRYRNLYEEAPIAYYSVNLDGRISRANRYTSEMSGYALDDLIGRPVFDLYADTPAGKVKAHKVFQQFRAGQEIRGEVVEWRRADGRSVWVSITVRPFRDAEGRVVESRAMAVDISELKRAEEALARRAAQLALLSDIGGKIAAVLELDRVLDRAVGLVRENFGYHHVALFTLCHQPEELVMRARAGSLTDIFPPDYRLKLDQGMVGWTARNGETLLANDVRTNPHYVNFFPDLIPTQSELSVPIRVGKEIMGVLDVQSPKLNAFDENDVMVIETLTNQIAVAIENARLYEAVQRELTERERAEAALQTYATKLEVSNRELEDFARVASHDLREPLRKVQAFGDRLQTRYGQALDEQGRDHLARMQNAAERMQVLIDDLLAYARVTTKVESFEPVELAQVVVDVISDLEMRIEQIGGRVEIGALPTVEADPVQMRQLLQNLISNALKFHRPNEAPVVKVEAGPLSGQVENSSSDELYQITVADNGIGFDEKYLERIFQVFQRLHGRGEYEGTGIGLATCRKIVERHGGTITAKSAPGQGATFIVTLPVKHSTGKADSARFEFAQERRAGDARRD